MLLLSGIVSAPPSPVTINERGILNLIPCENKGNRAHVVNNHLISNKGEWNNCFIKNNQEILLYLADFALQEQAEDNLMLAFS